MNTALVTGAAGFIGTWLVRELLSAGHKVVAFVRYSGNRSMPALERLASKYDNAIQIKWGDVRDPGAVADAIVGCDIVYHLAAHISIPYSYACPRDVLDVNINGTVNVALECVSRETPLLFVSSSEVYGTPRNVPICEDAPIRAQSPYAASKAAGEQCVQSLILSKGLQAVIVRPFNTFGPGQSCRAVIPMMISQALLGGALSLGRTDVTRDWVYVTDTVAGIRTIGERTRDFVGEAFNLGTGIERSVESVLREICNIIGCDVRLKTDPQRLRPSTSEVERLVADLSKTKTLLCWTPVTPLESGLRTTIDFLQNNPPATQLDLSIP